MAWNEEAVRRIGEPFRFTVTAEEIDDFRIRHSDHFPIV